MKKEQKNKKIQKIKYGYAGINIIKNDSIKDFNYYKNIKDEDNEKNKEIKIGKKEKSKKSKKMNNEEFEENEEKSKKIINKTKLRKI